MLISLIVVIISRSILTSKHYIVYFKYIQFSFVNHTLIKLKNETVIGTRSFNLGCVILSLSHTHYSTNITIVRVTIIIITVIIATAVLTLIVTHRSYY